MFHSCHSRATSRFEKSRTRLGHGMDVKCEFRREVESDSNELLGLSNQGSVRKKGSGGKNPKFNSNHVKIEILIRHQ